MKEYIALMMTDRYPSKGSIVIAVQSMIFENVWYVHNCDEYKVVVSINDIFIIGEL